MLGVSMSVIFYVVQLDYVPFCVCTVCMSQNMYFVLQKKSRGLIMVNLHSNFITCRDEANISHVAGKHQCELILYSQYFSIFVELFYPFRPF